MLTPVTAFVMNLRMEVVPVFGAVFGATQCVTADMTQLELRKYEATSLPNIHILLRF
jgi:hypothetical protein